MSDAEFNLTLTQTYPVAAERVFRAWTDPEAIKAWFQPSTQVQPVHAETDLRTGGDYQIKLQTADGLRYQLSGLYHEIMEPARLAFTWRWGDETDAEDTYVAVTLRQLGPTQTELTLFHDEFLSAEERDRHAKTWTGVLAQLGVYLAERVKGDSVGSDR